MVDFTRMTSFEFFFVYSLESLNSLFTCLQSLANFQRDFYTKLFLSFLYRSISQATNEKFIVLIFRNEVRKTSIRV